MDKSFDIAGACVDIVGVVLPDTVIRLFASPCKQLMQIQ
jgi:hypothetical protein